MTMATPTVTATDWMATRFATQPALSDVPVFVAAANEETPRPRRGVHGPYVTLRHLASTDRRYLGGRLAGSVVVIEVSAWDESTDAGRLGPIVQAFHDAIDAQRGTADDIAILSCARIAPVERQIAEDGKLFTQLGGEYRIRTSAP
jgi:hypothetical protein